MFEVHREVLGGLVPRARTLAESGQLELSTTPYQHPILPLVCGLDSRDFPHAGGSERPFRFVHPEDARDHVQRALDLFARCFGSPPVGMWPAEGAVSEAAAEVFELLMGSDVAPRKEFIVQGAYEVDVEALDA